MVRNLLVHLRGRGTDELRRIADCWDVALTGRADADHVAQLYRTLRDPWVVRDRVEALSNAEWAIIEAILASTPPPTPEALPALVALDPAAVTAALDALRGCGILATEPAAPLELPRELATAFRRVQEEQLLGPGLGPETPLRALLTTLEGGELEEAAEAWGLRATPGTIGREVLIDEILARVELPEQRRVVVRALPPGAGQVFGAIREAGGRQVLAALRADLKLGRPLLREAARVLNRRLLAWPTWDDAAGRSLIVPSDILAPRRPPRDAPPPLAEVAATPLPRPTYLYGAAWDLLTILQRLSQRTLEWRDGDEERNVTASRRLAPALWNGLLDTNRARQGYVPFLLVLALDEGLVRIEEERYVEHGPALEPWRGRSFPEQTRALLRRWRRAPDWPEGPSQEDLQLANVDWPGAREAVLSELRACVVGTWYDAIQLALRIARLRPSLLGGSFSAARASGPAGTREEVTVAAIEVLLHGALVPLGLLAQGSYMRGKREEAAVALTPIGSWLLGRGEEPAPAPRRSRAHRGGRFRDPAPPTGPAPHLGARRDRRADPVGHRQRLSARRGVGAARARGWADRRPDHHATGAGRAGTVAAERRVHHRRVAARLRRGAPDARADPAPRRSGDRRAPDPHAHARGHDRARNAPRWSPPHHHRHRSRRRSGARHATRGGTQPALVALRTFSICSSEGVSTHYASKWVYLCSALR